ncbi:ATP-NAD kinase family protein [Natranaerofaba carboxydovora]|uniref:ATP-NAD kinase family protein n=1 Tax=Natranaerofaba carboxydovora TaxID=2742683 RepID=UPI001F14295A|nr:ATP-NAD kinase family protein [Natranaerofaba carboxydovora]UMZ74294.1 ATP-NAD kinase [Natranaerofaba carboxydovora]
MKKIGLIVNPFSGMGGKVGLKGTDGKEILRKAISLGAEPEAPKKAAEALNQLINLKDQIKVYTFPGKMGEKEANDLGLKPFVLDPGREIVEDFNTTSKDTKKAAKEMMNIPVDLILFTGGDGTARDILDVIADKIPIIGIPAGVKMYSAVFAINPINAGTLAAKFIKDEISSFKPAEIVDLDENQVREGNVSVKLYGYVQIPDAGALVQDLKSGSSDTDASLTNQIATYVIDTMEKDKNYIIGPGTTTKKIMEKLDLGYHPLGIDVIKNKKLVSKDADEMKLLDIVSVEPASVIVTIIGGQGYIFGRGNQQISWRVLEKVGKKNINVIATNNKLASLHRQTLLIDTGNKDVNKKLSGYYRLITGYKQETIYKAKADF